jgi:putative PIN family toxin of toxin-antitoxin system
MKVLVDTNVLLSAALRNRLPERVLLHVAASDDFRWLATPEILAEYVEVLRRDKFGLTEVTLEHWANLLQMRTVNVGSPPATPVSFPDPKDAPFLAAVLATDADFLITGDKKLLKAKDVVATRIVTVAEFSNEYQIT